MIDSGIEPLTLTPTTRVKAYIDNDAYTPDYVVGDGLGIFITRPLNHWGFSDGYLNKELGYIHSNVQRHQEESALGKYLALAGMDYRFISLQGYSPSDWAEAIIYTNEGNDLASAEDALGAWFRGDIYTVCLERLEVYTNESGATIEQWEVEESIGCVLLDDITTLESVASDYFTTATV